MSLPQHLSQKLFQSRLVIEQVVQTFPSNSILIAWSGGKDSTLLLWLALQICQELSIPYPIALDIDQSDQFPEIEAFRDKMASDWKVPLAIVRNGDILDKVSCIGDRITVCSLNQLNQAAIREFGHCDPTFEWVPDSALCTHLLKNIPVRQYIKDNNIQVLMTGIRWDEHSSRESETYLSPRDNPNHIRAHPILHFTERDVWDVHFGLGIPFNSLYSLGYRSLGTRSGTHRAASAPAWEQDLAGSSERGGRSLEKERIMEQLRALGYM